MNDYRRYWRLRKYNFDVFMVSGSKSKLRNVPSPKHCLCKQQTRWKLAKIQFIWKIEVPILTSHLDSVAKNITKSYSAFSKSLISHLSEFSTIFYLAVTKNLEMMFKYWPQILVQRSKIYEKSWTYFITKIIFISTDSTVTFQEKKETRYTQKFENHETVKLYLNLNLWNDIFSAENFYVK